MASSNTLAHIGMPRRSGRYPFGSGERPFQRLTSGAKKLLKLDKVTPEEYIKSPRRKLSKYQLGQLTDEELKTINNRLQMEERYRELSGSATLAAGRRAAMERHGEFAKTLYKSIGNNIGNMHPLKQLSKLLNITVDGATNALTSKGRVQVSAQKVKTEENRIKAEQLRQEREALEEKRQRNERYGFT